MLAREMHSIERFVAGDRDGREALPAIRPGLHGLEQIPHG
jgi:hypothetical protein